MKFFIPIKLFENFRWRNLKTLVERKLKDLEEKHGLAKAYFCLLCFEFRLNHRCR